MHKSVSTDEQKYVGRGDNESLVKSGLPRLAADVLKVINRILNKLVGFFSLTDEEQKEAGVYLGHHRYE